MNTSDADLRKVWRDAGGEFYGPHVETGSMPEAKLLPFLRALIASRGVKGEPEPVAYRREISGINGHFIYSNIGDEGWAPLYAAPPSDAGMREALEEIEALCCHLRQGGPDPMDLQELSDALEEATNLASAALTAPGATTKSDGGVEGHADSMKERPVLSRADVHMGDPVRVQEAGIKPGPSDPSSTRSGVTVDDEGAA